MAFPPRQSVKCGMLWPVYRACGHRPYHWPFGTVVLDPQNSGVALECRDVPGPTATDVMLFTSRCGSLNDPAMNRTAQYQNPQNQTMRMKHERRQWETILKRLLAFFMWRFRMMSMLSRCHRTVGTEKN
jgi:hypothetical protein